MDSIRVSSGIVQVEEETDVVPQMPSISKNHRCVLKFQIMNGWFGTRRARGTRRSCIMYRSF